MPYPSEVAARMKDPKGFKKIRRENGKFGPGVDAIWGITDKGKTELQAVRFDAKKFTTSQVKAWCKKHNMSHMMVEPAKTESIENQSFSFPTNWEHKHKVPQKQEVKSVKNISELQMVYNKGLPMGFQRIVFNGKMSKARQDQMAGRDYLVVPMVMMTTGVHNGSNGPLFYPEDEMQKTPQAWNMKPIVVYHPNAPTACDPTILTNRQIGVVMNTKYEDGRWKSEAWLEPDRIKVVDNRIAKAIEKEEMLELSTGLYVDNEDTKGEWDNAGKKESYVSIARNYRPDHLAILPDQKGACSIEDGAGFLRLNSEGGLVLSGGEGSGNFGHEGRPGEVGGSGGGGSSSIKGHHSKDYKKGLRKLSDKKLTSMWKGLQNPPLKSGNINVWKSKYKAVLTEAHRRGLKWKTLKSIGAVKNQSFSSTFFPFLEAAGIDTSKLVANELSDNDVRRQLQALIQTKGTTGEVSVSQPWVEEVFSSFFVYTANGKSFMQTYEVMVDIAKLTGLPEEVIRIIRYKTNSGKYVTNVCLERKQKMSKLEKDKLIEALIDNESTNWTGVDREILDGLDETVLERMLPVVNEDKKEDEESEEEEDKKEDEVDNENTGESLTVDEYIAKAPEALRNPLQEMVANHEAEKRRLIKLITSNKKCEFTPDDLVGMDLKSLRRLSKLACNEEKKTTPVANYSGQADPVENVDNAEALSLPTMSFEKK